VIVPLAGGELLLVTVHADADDLEATWRSRSRSSRASTSRGNGTAID
jgi:hypothetical protein